LPRPELEEGCSVPQGRLYQLRHSFSPDALVRKQHDQVPKEFHNRLSYQQLDGCIWLPHSQDVSSIKS
jgi:hypothetical protein